MLSTPSSYSSNNRINDFLILTLWISMNPLCTHISMFMTSQKYYKIIHCQYCIKYKLCWRIQSHAIVLFFKQTTQVNNNIIIANNNGRTFNESPFLVRRWIGGGVWGWHAFWYSASGDIGESGWVWSASVFYTHKNQVYYFITTNFSPLILAYIHKIYIQLHSLLMSNCFYKYKKS